METILNILEDEYKLNHYLRKLLKYILHLYLSLFIYNKFGGRINLDSIFNDKFELSTYKVLNQAISYNILIPVLFIFLSYLLIWILNLFVSFIFRSLPTIWLNKKIEPFKILALSSKDLNELGLYQLKEDLKSLFINKFSLVSTILNNVLQKVFEILDDPNIEYTLAEKYENMEDNIDSKQEILLDQVLIVLGFLIALNSELFDFLKLPTYIFVILFIILLIYVISRLLLLLTLSFTLQFGVFYLDLVKKHIELKKLSN